ncbi:hypothetical protein CZ787_08390 [Halomonas citrativorans]|uniref:Response receiver domain-containing protein n=1 Tax=Halomonas citrativorans TaxID=2742612 RepID=A0A1R4HYG2_9GAMM|nr:response regulator receiver domain [Halomonas citrativorans]SJN12575.1 hypothetical protein CZ787_08390 [Halomonas citrativorans]
MDNMEDTAAVAEAPSPSPSEIWSEHIQSAVKEFLKTAVVIDNEPWVSYSTPEATAPLVSDDGFGEDIPTLVPPDAVTIENRHDLDVRAISDDFASKGIACAFVLPDDNDKHNNEKINRAVAAAKVSDLVIIDWYLKKQDESLTLQILQKIAESDSFENGRLRLICIYTGEPLKKTIFADAKEYLQKGGVSLNDLEGEEFCALGDSTIIVMKNKAATSASELPTELINIFSRFADGLVPAFSMAAVGAIRKSAHHMLTRFGNWLDAAYISNYIITNPSSDVSEMLRELFVAECDAALGIESVADRYLDSKPILKWLAANEQTIQVQNAGKNLKIDYALIDEILRNGIKDDNFFYGDMKDIKIAKDHRHFISSALAGSVDTSKTSQHEFARLVALKREAYGRSKLQGTEGWLPSLTTGTLIKYKIEDAQTNDEGQITPELFEYLVCLTPACDTLRLETDTPFVFLKARIENIRYGIVLKEHSSEETRLSLDSKKPIIRTFFFTPDAAVQRVLASRSEEGDFKFFDSGKREFYWLGEIRYTRAASEMAGLVRNWMRIGIADSEYLRLTGQGKT